MDRCQEIPTRQRCRALTYHDRDQVSETPRCKYRITVAPRADQPYMGVGMSAPGKVGTASWHQRTAAGEVLFDCGGKAVSFALEMLMENVTDWADPEHPFANDDPTTKEHRDAQDAWFQWFELSPYEVGCDELEAYVPTWAFGRKFEEGASVAGLPEHSVSAHRSLRERACWSTIELFGYHTTKSPHRLHRKYHQ